MRLLTLTNLYPSDARPRHGIFVRERLRHIVATGAVTADVVVLEPGISGFITQRSESVGEADEGISVRYVTVPALPKLSNWLDPWLWAKAVGPVVARLAGDAADAVVIDAHFLYPDGAAAVLIGRRLGIPVVVTARGSDVNVKGVNVVMRAWMRWAASNCGAIFSVSQALADRMLQLGIEPRSLEVLPNGVDLVNFAPRDVCSCRENFGVRGRALASVGHLIPEKGHDLVIEALSELPDIQLLIVGDGPERDRLERLAESVGVSNRVRFLGLVDHRDMPSVYCAVDALVLASMREGMPNVVLESLACGTPVVATRVGGVAELITSESAGRLVDDRSPEAIRAAIVTLFGAYPGIARTRDFAARFDWQPIVTRQVEIYRRVVAESAGITAVRNV